MALLCYGSFSAKEIMNSETSSAVDAYLNQVRFLKALS